MLGLVDGRKLWIQEINRFDNAPLELGGTLYWGFLALWANMLASMRICAQSGKDRRSGNHPRSGKDRRKRDSQA